MSFLQSLRDIGSGILDFVNSDSIGANLAKTALIGYAANKFSNNVNRENQRPQTSRENLPDPGVRLQVDPDPDHKIPVVYGTAYTGGIITDAELADANQTLYLCITVCERTGVKLSDSVQSVLGFDTVLVNDQRIVWDSDGVTVDYSVDREGNVDRSLSGLMQIRFYNNGSANNVAPAGETLGSVVTADNFMPSWGANHDMTELVFAIAKITYDRDKGVTRVPSFRFQVTNTMTKPGDVLLDYMTNTRYGAGIPLGEIASA